MRELLFQNHNGRTYRHAAKGCRGSRKERCAFTLVELLVVVAIIALLVSILLPTLGKAKEQARIVMCMANARSLGLSFTFYTDENNDWLPAGASSSIDEYTWGSILQPYYDVFGLLHCPSDKGVRDWDSYGTPEEERHPRSFAINTSVTWMGPSSADPDFWPGWVHKITEVTDPTDTILLAEQWKSLYWGTAWLPGMYKVYQGCGAFAYWETSWPGRGPTLDVHRNNDAANYLFCDGHVDLIQANDPQLDSTEDYYYWHRKK